ncbi:MAG: ketoacyl-ACP synthase III [Spirochaetales bacterium]|nr:ketoacyl-ACP synthase III [Spirochaetales bacterium]
MKKAFIKAISYKVPEKRVSNDELAKTVDTSDEWIYSHTGIKYRHIAEEQTAASDLALQPCLDVIEQADIDPKEIDLIIVATITQDYVGFPSTACVLQDRLGAVNAGAMDLAAACTGYIYSLETAKALIKTGSAKNILLVSSEILTKITDWTDRNTCVLFGDGAGASLVSLNEENTESDILFSILGAEGNGAPYLIRMAGGSRYPIRPHSENRKDGYIRMDGQKVYHFAVRVLCKTIKRILEKYNLSIDDIAYIVPHQANIRIIEAAAKRLKIPIEKFYVNIQEYANTSGATIPIALGEMVEKGLLRRGDYIITVGFGGGLTYGGNLICW